MIQIHKAIEVIAKLSWQRYGLFVATLLLYVSYSSNVFRVLEPERFQAFQKDSQSLVELKMLEVKDGDGISEGGFLRVNKPFFVKRTEFTYDSIDHTKNARYNSQFGLQGLIATVVQKFVNGKVDQTIVVLEHIVAFLQALVIALFLKRIATVTNVATSLICFGLLLFSPMLTCFSRNLYWVSFTQWLPFVLAFWMYPRAFQSKKWFYATLLVIFSTLLLKCLCGYEFISAIILAPCVAAFYFAFRLRIPLKRTVLHCIGLCLAGTLGFITALLLHWAFLSYSFSSAELGMQAITDRAGANTYGDFDPTEDGPELQPLRTLIKYFLPVAVNVGARFSADTSDIYILKISYVGTTVLAFAAALFLTCIHGLKGHSRASKRTRAAVASLVIAMLASISWFILAPSHSQVHTTINGVLFFLPFIPTLSILLGEVVITIGAAFSSPKLKDSMHRV